MLYIVGGQLPPPFPLEKSEDQVTKDPEALRVDVGGQRRAHTMR